VLIVGKLKWIKITDDFKSGLIYIANKNSVFYFRSNKDAPRGKIVRYDLDNPVLSRSMRINVIGYGIRSTCA
jgi:hypothetical protein